MAFIEENWNYHTHFIEIEMKYNLELEFKVNNSLSNLYKQLENRFKIKSLVYDKSAAHQDDELKALVEKNEELRHQIDLKLEDISKQRLQYETYKKDQRLLSQEIKETHEAFLMAKKYYKKFLKIYYTVESRNDDKQIIFLQFFTEAKKDSENYSVRLQRNTKSGLYKLLKTTPKISSSNELQRKLQDTNDIPGALCSIRQAFIDIKNNRK